MMCFLPSVLREAQWLTSAELQLKGRMSSNNAGRPNRQHDEFNNSEDPRRLSFGEVNEYGGKSKIEKEQELIPIAV